MKVFVFSFLVASLATVAWTSSITWGRRISNDTILSRDIVVVKAQNGNFQSATIMFPKSGQGNNKNISAICVSDNFRNKSGAVPSLWSGGPNYKFATINFKSSLSNGINSTVEIYGRK